MDSNSEQQPNLVKGKDRLASEPIGDVILGKVDPRTLSEDEFAQSSDLLFHGAGRGFTFKRVFDYQPDRESEVSQTLGYGLYLTDSRLEASTYSKKRTGDADRPGEVHVLEFLPYQVRMLDLRDKNNPKYNAPVPLSLVKSWNAYLKDYIDNKFGNYDPNEEVNLINNATAIAERQARMKRLGDYQRLRGFLTKSQGIIGRGDNLDIRRFLSGDGDTQNWGTVVHLFPKFMMSVGYDGLIAPEGGDVKEQYERNPVSYVFFNLDKIGTYETWHTVDQEISPAEVGPKLT